MNIQVSRWWEPVVRGLVAVVFGVFLLARPGPSLAGLILAFGIWMFVDGVTSLLTAVARRGSWELVIEGFAGIALGVLTWRRPGITAIALYTLAIIWVLVVGVMQVASAIERRHEQKHVMWLGLSGAISVLLGVLMLATPTLGAAVLATWLGIYGIALGAVLIAFGLDLKSTSRLPAT